MSLFLHKLYTAVMAILAFPVVIAVRILRPFVLIRFGMIPSHRLGHFAANIEKYNCEERQRIQGKRVIDFFYHNYTVSNYQLKRMWERVLLVFSFAKWVDKVNSKFPGYQRHKVPLSLHRDMTGVLRNL